ncbi:MAG: site-2 protease family protein [Alphaproteobacteria bacterium]|nr:site-2 protease family protein [Alphaproteobacteria bacterium]
MISLVYIAAFVLVLSIVVIIHEGGHFIVARLCGVQATHFSLGFGKVLWSRVDKYGTKWQVCAIPLGGYVRMLGDEDAAGAKSSSESIPESERHKTFMAKKLWQRAAIVFAGPAMNYLFAFVALVGMLYFLGEIIVKPIVSEVMPDSAAAEAGLQVNDEIVAINNHTMQDFSDIQRVVRLTDYGKPLQVEIMRDQQKLVISLLPKMDEQIGMPVIGIRSSHETVVMHQDLSFGQAVLKSAEMLYTTTRDTLIYLGQVISARRAPKDMRGPLGIAEASGDALMGGWLSLLSFLVQISIAVGFMNLLPIPMLDGGHLCLYAIEAVRRKPLTEKTQAAIMWTGFSVLMLIFAYTMILDVPRIIQRITG